MWLDVKDLHVDPTITHSFNHAWNPKLVAWTDSHQLSGRRKVHAHSEFFSLSENLVVTGKTQPWWLASSTKTQEEKSDNTNRKTKEKNKRRKKWEGGQHPQKKREEKKTETQKGRTLRATAETFSVHK
jgi:hypothetical protein